MNFWELYDRHYARVRAYARSTLRDDAAAADVVQETFIRAQANVDVPGLPVFAAADTRAKAERAIRETLTAYLEAHPDSVPTTAVRVARVSDGERSKVDIVGVGALLGTGRSRRKARASQVNGRLGGRPRKTA